MTELTTLDYVIFGVAAVFVIWGLIRGLSGQLGAFSGLIAALATGYFGYSYAVDIVYKSDIVSGGATAHAASVAVTVVMALVAFGLVCFIVTRFVSFVVPQPMNAMLGAVCGIFKTIVLIGLLTGFGLIRHGEYSDGPLVSHSTIIRTVALWADDYASGAERP